MHTLVTGAGAQIVVPDVRGDKVMLHSKAIECSLRAQAICVTRPVTCVSQGRKTCVWSRRAAGGSLGVGLHLPSGWRRRR